MGYIAANEYAWDLCCQLIHETVKTAAAAGLNFDEEKVREKVKNTSIKQSKRMHFYPRRLRDGRRTEVDTISGALYVQLTSMV